MAHAGGVSLTADHFGIDDLDATMADITSSVRDEAMGDDWGITFTGSTPFQLMRWISKQIQPRGLNSVGALVGTAGAGKSSAILRAAEEGVFSLAPIYILIANREGVSSPWQALRETWRAAVAWPECPPKGSGRNQWLETFIYLLVASYLDWLVFVLEHTTLPREPVSFGRVLARYAFSAQSATSITHRFNALVASKVRGSQTLVARSLGRLKQMADAYGRLDARFFLAFDEIVALMDDNLFVGHDGESARTNAFGLMCTCFALRSINVWSVVLGSSWSLSAEIKSWSRTRFTCKLEFWSEFDAFPPARVFQTMVSNGLPAFLRRDDAFALCGRPLWSAGCIRVCRAPRLTDVSLDEAIRSQDSNSVSHFADAVWEDLFSGSDSAARCASDIVIVAVLESGIGCFSGTKVSVDRPHRDARTRVPRPAPPDASLSPHSGSRSCSATAERAPALILRRPSLVLRGLSTATELVPPPSPPRETLALSVHEFAVFRGYLNTADATTEAFSVCGDGVLSRACDAVATDIALLSVDEDCVFENLASRIVSAVEAAPRWFELAVAWVFCRLGRQRAFKERLRTARETWAHVPPTSISAAAGARSRGARSGEAVRRLDTLEDVCSFAWAPLCKSVLRFDLLCGEATRGTFSSLLASLRDVDADCLETEFHALFRRDGRGKRVPSTDHAVAYTRDGTSGPDVIFWAVDRFGRTRLVLVQAKSGSVGTLRAALNTLDPAAMFPKTNVRSRAFDALLADSEVAPFFRNPIRLLMTTRAVPGAIREGMSRWNDRHPDALVFAFQGSSSVFGRRLWDCYGRNEGRRVPVPEDGCDDFALQRHRVPVARHPSVVRLPDVTSTAQGDTVSGLWAARFVQGVLGRFASRDRLQEDLDAAEAVACQRWTRPARPSDGGRLASFFDAAAEAFNRAYKPPVALEGAVLRERVEGGGPTASFDELIARTALDLDVSITVEEYGIQRTSNVGGSSTRALTIFRNWCQYCATPPTRAAERST